MLDEQGLELRLQSNRLGTIGTPAVFVRPVRVDEEAGPITVALLMRAA
jgi:hypothetical protein